MREALRAEKSYTFLKLSRSLSLSLALSLALSLSLSAINRLFNTFLLTMSHHLLFD